jgi:hypothetical protein
MKVHAALALLAGIALCLGAVRPAQAETFPPKAAKAFVEGCKRGYAQATKAKTTGANTQKANTLCSCGLKQVEQTMSADDFAKATAALQRSQKGETLDADAQQKIELLKQAQGQIAAQCVETKG